MNRPRQVITWRERVAAGLSWDDALAAAAADDSAT
jgi:hypothetical protein